MKPSLTAPFLLIIAFVLPNYRVMIISILIYVLLTILAFYFQKIEVVPIPSAIGSTYFAVDNALSAGSRGGGYGNIHSLLEYFGLQHLNIVSSLILYLIFGYWIYKNRHADIFMLLGITAIFSRLWIYHRVYDDILIFIPMLTLFRMIKARNIDEAYKQFSLILLVATVCLMILPARLQQIKTYEPYFIWSHTLIWILLFNYFIYMIYKKRKTY